MRAQHNPDPPSSHWTVRTTLRLRRYFLSGLATLLPAVVTLYVLVILFKFADGLLGRFINRYWLRTYGYEIAGLGFVMTGVLILLVGVFSSHLFGQWIFRRVEGWFGGLPMIRRIYQPVKQLAAFLLEQKDGDASFRRVVLVEFPRAGSYSIAFVTNESPATAVGASGTLLTLLVPTAPSPLTGPIIFVRKEETIPLKMPIEEALRLIVSGGIVAPPLEALKTEQAV